MKKKILGILMLLLFLVPMTGCVKYNATMEIKADKSMNFDIIYAFDTNIFGNKELLTEEEKENIKNNGFKFTDYVDEDMKGFTLSRHFPNIDDVSSTGKVEYDLGNLFKKNEKNKIELFKVEKGFYKNKYTAIIKFDSDDSSLNSPEYDAVEDSLMSDDTESVPEDEELEDEYIEEDTEETEGSIDDFSSLLTFDLKFTVKLPNKPLSNNATTVSEDGKTLEWELTTDEVSSMEFSFELENESATLILIGIGAGALVLLIVIVLIVVKVIKKNRKNKGNTTISTAEVVQPQPVPVVPVEPVQEAGPTPMEPVQSKFYEQQQEIKDFDAAPSEPVKNVPEVATTTTETKETTAQPVAVKPVVPVQNVNSQPVPAQPTQTVQPQPVPAQTQPVQVQPVQNDQTNNM